MIKDLVDFWREYAAVSLISATMSVFPKRSWLGVQFSLMVKQLFEAYGRLAEQERLKRKLQEEWKRKVGKTL